MATPTPVMPLHFAQVLRDFALDLVDDAGNPMSADEYLAKSLKPQMGFDDQVSGRSFRVPPPDPALFSPSNPVTLPTAPLGLNARASQTAERNRIRQMLSGFFQDMRCFALVRPLADEKQLQEIDKVNGEDALAWGGARKGRGTDRRGDKMGGGAEASPPDDVSIPGHAARRTCSCP